jgi:uncharacterized membrane protein
MLRAISVLLWAAALLGAVMGVSMLLSQGPVLAGMAVCFALLPYIAARAWDQVTGTDLMKGPPKP